MTTAFRKKAFWKNLAPSRQALRLAAAAMAFSLLAAASPQFAKAQDNDPYDQSDPPGRVARLGYMQGAISFQPAGENEWVQAVSNRPITTGDKLWADRDARAEVQLGSAMVNLAPNTGFSFLNLDDRTVQMEVTAGAINVRVWSMDRDSIYEIDTPNQAFTIEQPGRYRIETSENGDYSVVTIWQGAGESTGNGQSYTLRAGQRTTFTGTTSLNAEVDQVGPPDDFDNWTLSRERRYDNSPSARYCSREVVGYDDLDDYGQWQNQGEYGPVWYPRVNAGWAPYREGHWAWIDPWGWTWVDDDPWGYAPFHYGRWAYVGNRWGWIPGPPAVRPVYAPALVVFVGGGGMAFGGNVAWFPLGPREVYVPSYQVSRGYVNRVNVSNTVVNQTTITNVYNTTIINKTTNITNVTYVNRNVNNAVTAVPQRSFVSAQPVARAAVPINRQQIDSAPMSSRAAVPPAREAVLGLHANTANRVAAPSQAIANRTVTAKAAPPPPPPSFASRQQSLTRNPGQSIGRPELQKLAPATAPARMVRVAPPSKPATATPTPANQLGNRPANPAANDRPGANQPPTAQPNNRPQPNQPAPVNNQPQPNNRPTPNAQPNQPTPPARNDRPNTDQPNSVPRGNAPDNDRPQPNQPQPNNRPAPGTQPNSQPNRTFEPPARNDRPTAQPNDRPQPSQPAPNSRPDNSRPDDNRPQPSRPGYNQPNQPVPNNRPTPNPAPNRQPEPPARSEQPSSTPPTSRPTIQPAPNNRPDTNRPDNNRPETARPSEKPPNAPADRPETTPRQQEQRQPPADARPAPLRQPEKPKPEDRKNDDKQRPQ